MASAQGKNICCSLALSVFVVLCITHAGGETVGVCYGMNSDSLPSDADVVSLMKSNNIGKVRIYKADRDTLQALQNSGIEVIVGVENTELEKIAGDQAAATGWVTDNIVPFSSVNIKYIAVGNEVYANRQYLSYLLPAMNNIQTAVNNANLQSKMKVSTPHKATLLSTSYPPSDGTFSDDLSGILKFLSDNGSPFMAHVYPYFSYIDNSGQISAEYALFTSTSTVVTDGSLMYKNLFDATVDAFIAAMGKQGYPNLPIVITESGWASAGSAAATVDNARTYNNNLIKHVLSTEGTPKRPGNTIETYIFALFNENQKGGNADEQHFGLFETNKTPVYPTNFSP